jgi:hypothetical protein
MSEFIEGIAILALYRIFTIACSMAVIFWGYGLLRNRARAVDATDASRGTKLARAATGAMLALVGTLTLGVSILRGIDVDALASAGSKKAASIPAESPASNAATPQSPNGTEVSANDGVPDEIREVLNKASAGETLSQPEQNILRGWMSRNQSIDRGLDPPNPGARKGKTRHVPVPAPGEV